VQTADAVSVADLNSRLGSSPEASISDTASCTVSNVKNSPLAPHLASATVTIEGVKASTAKHDTDLGVIPKRRKD